jgi:hypothetical protein
MSTQTTSDSSKSYISSFEVCKYTPNYEHIYASGTVNFYMSYIGLFSAETGEVDKIWRIWTDDDAKFVSSPSEALMMDSTSSSLYGAIQFMGHGLDVFKIDLEKEKFKWQK